MRRAAAAWIAALMSECAVEPGGPDPSPALWEFSTLHHTSGEGFVGWKLIWEEM